MQELQHTARQAVILLPHFSITFHPPLCSQNAQRRFVCCAHDEVLRCLLGGATQAKHQFMENSNLHKRCNRIAPLLQNFMHVIRKVPPPLQLNKLFLRSELSRDNNA